MTDPIRLVTWNIHGSVGIDRRRDPQRIVSVLAGLDADIVGLQEVAWHKDPHGGPEQLHLLARELGMARVEGPNLDDDDGAFGNGLLVRGEVLFERQLDLAEPGREPRGAIDAVVRVRGVVARILVTHLGLSRGERRRQQRRLLQWFGSGAPDGHEPAFTAVMGDLNEWLPVPRRLHILRREHLPCTIGGRSFPSILPTFALDRILLAPDGLRCSGRVVRDRPARIASDHLPLVAEIMPPEAASDRPPGPPTGGAPSREGSARGGGR